jgi:hypothetical protein
MTTRRCANNGRETHRVIGGGDGRDYDISRSGRVFAGVIEGMVNILNAKKQVDLFWEHYTAILPISFLLKLDERGNSQKGKKKTLTDNDLFIPDDCDELQVVSPLNTADNTVEL